MVGSSGAEAAFVEATDQRKQTGTKRERSPEEKQKHNEHCRVHRAKKKRKLENLETLVPMLQAENQKMKREMEELIAKIERLLIELEQLRPFKEEVEKRKEMMRQIPTSWEVDGQKFSSFEHCQDLILSQNYEQVGQGSDYSNVAASDAGPFSMANPDCTSPPDSLDIDIFFGDLAAGSLSDPGASSSGANLYLPASDADAPGHHDNIGLFTDDPAAGTLNNPGDGSFGANDALPFWDDPDYFGN